jgi:cadmium resistance protein CadD (predicted permease)
LTWFISAILLGIVTFTITNIDDILVLAILFAHAKVSVSLKARYVVIGQYSGFIILILISLLIYLSSLVIPLAYIGLLGIVPIVQGIWRLKQLMDKPQALDDLEEAEAEIIEKEQTSVWYVPAFLRSVLNVRIFSIITITIGNGSDSLSIYPAIFARGGPLEIVVLIIVFLCMLFLWCLLGYALTRVPGMAKVLERYGHYILPPCLITLGLFILTTSGTWNLFLALIHK